jgi:outer membrane biosynthesis protein TonB
MVIEEPAAPEEPPAPLPQPTSPPEPARRPRRRLRTEPPTAAAENTPETTEPPPTPQVPSLEPRESSAQEAALRRQIQGLQDDVRQRIAKLSRAGLSGADRKTLDDARTFFAQSTRALSDADLQRALNLARKASLLVSALEP